METKTKKANIQKIIVDKAELLSLRHSTYVDKFVTLANDELYAILAEIMALYEQVNVSQDQTKLIKHIRQNLSRVHNIKTQANTKTTALVVKLVTRANRKTSHVYSRVLEVAIAAGVKSDCLVEFIKLKGGIDKVRMAVNSAEAVSQHKTLVKHYQHQLRDQLAQKSAIGTADLSAIKSTLPSACDVEFEHLLCRFNPVTNAHEVVGYMYPSSALETQAMNEYLTMLDVACHSEHSSFYQRCQQHGLNMDILLRWMHANGIKDAAAARAIALSLKPAANSAAEPPPTVLLKAA